MFTAPDVLQMAQDMARHAAQRQAVTARNTANADTPGYRARDLSDFTTVFDGAPAMRQTRGGHLRADPVRPAARIVDAGGAADPNGNTVSLEQEMVRAAEARSQHDTALSIYRASLDLMKTSLGRGR